MMHYKQKETIQLHQDYDDWGVLFDRETNQSLVINPVGIVIWQELKEQRSINELVNAVRKAFEDAPPEIREDVTEFLAGLVEGDFVFKYS